jgi:hypothetical protein
MKQDSAFFMNFPITVVFSIIITGILWLVFDMYIGFSFLLGSMVSLMGMSMMFKSTKRMMDTTTEQHVAVKASIRSYIFRYFFYALILVIAGISENLEIIAVAAGLFSFRICLYLSMFIVKRRGVKE